MAIRLLRMPGTILVAMIALDAAWSPLTLLAITLRHATVAPLATGLDAAAVVVTLATYLVFAFWLHRAGANLVAAGHDALEFTPASRIWWFAVPFANLVKPYQGMRELYNASRGHWPYDLGAPVVATWWALWLGNGIASWLILRAQIVPLTMTLLWALAALKVARAAAAILIVVRVSRAQAGLAAAPLGEVFA